MTEITLHQPTPAQHADAEAFFAHELADARGAMRLLRNQLERVARQEQGQATWGGLEITCAESARVATAMARLQLANAASALALARLRDGGTTQRIIVERRG